MKLPGLGEVNDKNLMIGGGVVAGIVSYAYYKRRQARNAATAADNSGTSIDPNAIDPSTGVPYGQEQGYGSNYYQGTISNPYVSQTGSTTGSGSTTGQYTSNTSWYADALTEATNYFGVSFTTATSGFGKYLTQDRAGLNPSEYQAVSEVVALLGQPPNGGPYRLIQAAPGAPSPSPSPSPAPTPLPAPSGGDYIPPGYHMQPPQYAVLPGSMSLRQYWQQHYPGNQQALQNLIDYNPSIPVDWTAHWALSIKTSNAHLVPDR